MILKVLGVWLIVDALGSWLYDMNRIAKGEMDGQKLIVHAVRFIRTLIGTLPHRTRFCCVCG